MGVKAVDKRRLPAMIPERLRILLLLICTSLVLSPAVAQTKAVKGQNEAPVVNEYRPQSGSVYSLIELKGLRLESDDVDSTKVIFIQNGIEIPARTDGGSWVTNDRLNGMQAVKVIVPEDVVFGSAQIVAERNGLRSAPVTITITEWSPPVIKQVIPDSGPPGTVVNIVCENFHDHDQIELTDGEGSPVTNFGGGGASNGTAFRVPEDSPEGVLRIRIGNPKVGKDQFTPAVEFFVTNEALPLELVPEWIKPVAPGQWVDLQASSLAPLKHSEKTEVSFKQTGREIIVTAPRPLRPRVEVPAVLSPGEVQVQVRTWRNGRPSTWSTPVTLQVAEKPLPPYVAALRLEKGTWVQLWPGPDRTTNFNAAAGDLIVMNGIYPAEADELKVLLVRSGEVVELNVTELNEKADWFSEITVKLPARIGVGDWQMIVRAIDGSEHVVPIPIRISLN